MKTTKIVKVVMLPNPKDFSIGTIITFNFKENNVVVTKIGIINDMFDTTICVTYKTQHGIISSIGLNEENKDIKTQELYFISTDPKDEIKEGEWYIIKLFNIEGKSEGWFLEQCRSIIENIWVNKNSVELTRHIENCKKIIATTDLSLSLPLIPESFVEAYVKAEGKIDEVQIEMSYKGELYNEESTLNTYHPKLRDDGTVIVHQSKTYTREEVIALLRIAFDAELEEDGRFEKWIEDNLK